ncbi:glycosyltransferase [Algoriphagus formosus]|uniref:Glycosyltransferase n=1 Tax=Algoriphagus formosus TaxID=2007308 RepID=A0A4R5UW91_9BACT|nr:glycosyltransferase [Algoriphagus aquimaris]TDK43326.1 glycosyltransferase [Algoriphagus aquimaris]
MSIFPEELGVVVVTYKRPEALRKTIFAILSQGITEAQIVVLNNDPSVQLLSEEIDPNFTSLIIKNQSENIASAGGFAKGMQAVLDLGLKWAWLFNDDSRPVRGSLDSLKYAVGKVSSPKIGLVKIGNLNNRGKATLLNWKGVRVPSYVEPSGELIETDLVTFDGCLISTQLIQEIGTCDPGYFMGTYEFDYCLRAKDAGYSIFTLPNGLIEDEKAGSIGGTPPWRQYYNTRNHLFLGLQRKNMQTIAAWIKRELKYTYAIIRFEDQKLIRLKLKALATFHALLRKRGKTFDPARFN